MSFSNRIFRSLEEWATNVPPAPRCSEWDTPCIRRRRDRESRLYLNRLTKGKK